MADPMTESLHERHHAAIVIGVYATLMLDLFGSVTSSPQTTELFARDRKKTLMKYVYMADVGGIAIGTIMSFVDDSPYPLIGAAAIAFPMHCLYVHAARVGQAMPPPMTANQAGTPTAGLPTHEQSGKHEQGKGSVSGGHIPMVWNQAA
jgi:hypothetical protein